MKENLDNSIFLKGEINEIKNNFLEINIPKRGEMSVPMISPEQHEQIEHLQAGEKINIKAIIVFYKNLFRNKKNILRTIIFPDDPDYEIYLKRAESEIHELDKQERFFENKNRNL